MCMQARLAERQLVDRSNYLTEAACLKTAFIALFEMSTYDAIRIFACFCPKSHTASPEIGCLISTCIGSQGAIESDEMMMSP